MTSAVGCTLHSRDEHRPARSEPDPYGKLGVTAGREVPGRDEAQERPRLVWGPACTAALELALVLCKLPVTMCILFQINTKNSYFYLTSPCQVLAPESGRISKEKLLTPSPPRPSLHKDSITMSFAAVCGHRVRTMKRKESLPGYRRPLRMKPVSVSTSSLIFSVSLHYFMEGNICTDL